jgi:hypothetical protein
MEITAGFRANGAKAKTVPLPFVDPRQARGRHRAGGRRLWQVKSMDEAVARLERCPDPMSGEASEEIRPIFEAEDFGSEFTPELRAQEDTLRAEMERKRGG